MSVVESGLAAEHHVAPDESADDVEHVIRDVPNSRDIEREAGYNAGTNGLAKVPTAGRANFHPSTGSTNFGSTNSSPATFPQPTGPAQFGSANFHQHQPTGFANSPPISLPNFHQTRGLANYPPTGSANYSPANFPQPTCSANYPPTGPTNFGSANSSPATFQKPAGPANYPPVGSVNYPPTGAANFQQTSPANYPQTGLDGFQPTGYLYRHCNYGYTNCTCQSLHYNGFNQSCNRQLFARHSFRVGQYHHIQYYWSGY